MEYWTINYIAEITGRSKRQVMNWKADYGMPFEGETRKGVEVKIDPSKFMDWWGRYNVQLVTGTDLQAERTRLTKEQADRAYMDNEVQRGQLVEVPVIRKFIVDMVSRFRSKLLAFPSRCAPMVQAAGDELQSIKRVMDDGIREALQELSDSYGEGHQEGDSAAADSDGEPVGGSEAAA